MICDNKTIFHDYKTLRNDIEVIVEICSRCKKKLITRKGVKGRIDNEAYSKEHIKDFMQSNHKYFEKEHGKEKL